MNGPFDTIRARPDEVTAQRLGDDIVTETDVVMDRAFTVAAPPERAWPFAPARQAPGGLVPASFAGTVHPA